MHSKYSIKTELYQNKQEALDQKRKRRMARHRQSVNHDLKFGDMDKSARSSVNQRSEGATDEVEGVEPVIQKLPPKSNKEGKTAD